MLFFTADHHFGHANIIRYCARPFVSVHEMNVALTEAWNSVVAPDDEVWHLGDFAFGKPEVYLSRLNGRKFLVKGNHDKKPHVEHGWEDVITEYARLERDGYQFFLRHYPDRVKYVRRELPGFIYLHGHCHGALPKQPGILDVGVDVSRYAPMSQTEILKRLETR